MVIAAFLFLSITCVIIWRLFISENPVNFSCSWSNSNCSLNIFSCFWVAYTLPVLVGVYVIIKNWPYYFDLPETLTINGHELVLIGKSGARTIRITQLTSIDVGSDRMIVYSDGVLSSVPLVCFKNRPRLLSRLSEIVNGAIYQSGLSEVGRQGSAPQVELLYELSYGLYFRRVDAEKTSWIYRNLRYHNVGPVSVWSNLDIKQLRNARYY